MTCATSSCEGNPCLLTDVLGEVAHTAHAIVGANLSHRDDQDYQYFHGTQGLLVFILCSVKAHKISHTKR